MQAVCRSGRGAGGPNVPFPPASNADGAVFTFRDADRFVALFPHSTAAPGEAPVTCQADLPLNADGGFCKTLSQVRGCIGAGAESFRPKANPNPNPFGLYGGLNRRYKSLLPGSV